MRPDGTVTVWGDYTYGETNIPPGLSNVVTFSTSGFSSVAVRSNGTVVASPANTWAASSLPPGLTNIVAVAAGPDNTLALGADGRVTAWGPNVSGESIVPPDLTNVVAVAAGNWHSLALRADGTVVAWGSVSDGQSYAPFDLTNAVAIAAGLDQSVALRADGRVVAWGETAAVPPSATNIIAISAGYNAVVALRSDGTVMAWGINSVNLPPGLTNVVAIASGTYHDVQLIGAGKPFLLDPLVDRSIIRGHNVYFRMAASGEWPLTYQWQYNGTNIAGGNGSVLTVTNVQLPQSGTSSVLVSNALGWAKADALLTVVPQTATIFPDSLLITNGVVQLNAVGSPYGSIWTLQGSTNLIDWVTVQSQGSYGDTMTFTDSTNLNRRFYRLKFLR